MQKEDMLNISPNKKLRTLQRNATRWMRIKNYIILFYKLIRSGHFFVVIINPKKKENFVEMQSFGMDQKGVIMLVTKALEAMLLIQKKESQKPEPIGDIDSKVPKDLLNNLKKGLN